MGSPKNRLTSQRSQYSSFQLHGTPPALEEAWPTIFITAVLILQFWMFFVKPQLATLTCDRPSPSLGNCQLVLSGLFGKKVTAFPLDQLEGAEVGHNGKLRQLVLQLSGSKLYFPTNYGLSSPEDKATQINAFLQDSAMKSLSLRQDNRWFIYSIGLMSTGFSGLFTWLYILDLLKRSSHRSNL